MMRARKAIRKCFSIILIAIFCLQTMGLELLAQHQVQAPEHLAPSTNAKDPALAMMHLVRLLQQFDDKYGRGAHKRRGGSREQPWKIPSETMLKEIKDAAREVFGGDDWQITVDRDFQSLVLQYSEKPKKVSGPAMPRAIILSSRQHDRAEDQMLLSDMKIAEEIDLPPLNTHRLGPFFASAYSGESAVMMGRRTVTRMILAALFGGLTLLPGHERAKTLRKASTYADVYMIYGFHVEDLGFAEEEAHVLREIIAKLPRRPDGTVNAVYVMESGANTETVFGRFRAQYPEHRLLSPHAIISDASLREKLRPIYDANENEWIRTYEEMYNALPKDPRQAGTLRQYRMAIMKNYGIPVQKEQTSFESWLATIPMLLPRQEAWSGKKDYAVYQRVNLERMKAVWAGNRARDIELQELINRLHHEDPRRVILSLRGSVHGAANDLFQNRDYRFEYVQMVSEQYASATHWVMDHWEAMEKMSDTERGEAFAYAQSRNIVESFLWDFVSKDLNAVNLIARRSTEILQAQLTREDVPLNAWLEKLFYRANNPGELAIQILEELFRRKILTRDPANPQMLRLLGGGIIIEQRFNEMIDSNVSGNQSL